MTDRGQFEDLAAAILRRANEEYAYLIQTGVNAAGEPIKSPIDAFCRVPDKDPPRFLVVASTTTDRKSLKAKWLHDSSGYVKGSSERKKEDGDLLKAKREADSIREDISNAEFIVILVTNQRVDDQLLKEVAKKSAISNLEYDIWEQSRLADFLDNTPEGHWLGKKYLGIEAEMLSRPLLRSLCMKSRDAYKEEVSITNPDIWTPREIDKKIQDSIQGSNYSIQYFVGGSGNGKSVAAFRTLEDYLKSGKFGLWLPAASITDSLSLEEALDKELRRLHPTLQPDSGRTAINLLQDNERLLLIVDDINRSPDPSRFAQLLQSWSKPHPSGIIDSPSSLPKFQIICPLWPEFWEVFQESLSRRPWANIISIGLFKDAEGRKAVQTIILKHGVDTTMIDAETLAKQMGHDPLIIGLFDVLLESVKSDNYSELADDIIQRFLDVRIRQQSNSEGASYLAEEYQKALLSICLHMLRMKNLHPLWDDVTDWLKDAPEILGAIRDLARQGQVCRIGDQKQFVFRHDRLQEFLLEQAMTELLTEVSIESHILTEPFYAGLIGKTIAKISIQRSILDDLRNHNPLALFEAVKHFGTPTSEYHNAIIEEIQAWIDKDLATGNAARSLIDAICWSLIEVDSSVVLEITEKFPSSRLLQLARLRNGCAKSGAIYCIGLVGFVPSMRNILRDRAIAHGLHRHKKRLIKDLKGLLKAGDISDDLREGALALAGFLESKELHDEIAICWNLVNDKTRVLPEAIWASMRCSDQDPAVLLNPLFAYWSTLPDEEDALGRTMQLQVSEHLRFAVARGVSNNVVSYLISQCNVRGSLDTAITYLLEYIDSPNAIEFITRKVADVERKLAGTDRFSPWTMTLTDKWNPFHKYGRKLSNESMECLRSLWDDTQNDEFTRKSAFRLWSTSADQEDLDILRTRKKDSPLFKSAISKRVKLGDMKVVSDLISLLEQETHWFLIAHNVWCAALRHITEYQLQSLKDITPSDYSGGRLDPHHFLSEFLMKIPAEDAESLLELYWDHLQYSPLFIQTALYAGTPRCLDLAASAIEQFPVNIPIFEHMATHIGYLNTERHQYLSSRHFDNILPYLDRFDETELREWAEAAQRLGIPEWSNINLAHRLGHKERSWYHPTDDDLILVLDEIEKDPHGVPSIRFWLEGFEKRHDPKHRALVIAEQWLASNPSEKRFLIVADIISRAGSRRDLLLLDKYDIKGSFDNVSRIKESARFSLCRRTLD